VACLYQGHRVVIHDLETGKQKDIKSKWPLKCATSQHLWAITTDGSGMHVYSTDGTLVHIIPDSTEARCVAFHPRNTNILAIGYGDGTVRIRDMNKLTFISSFKKHILQITNIRFSVDCRLFVSSWDNTASIVTLDDQFQCLSSVKLKGHTDCVFDILPLSASNHCVTCNQDGTLKVWDSETGVCLRTLTEHTDWVTSVAMYPNGQYFASGSDDRTVIIWSSETFEVLRRFTFPSFVQSLVFSESDILYIGVHDQGVISCDTLTGEIGPVIIPGTESCFGLSLGE
jgi:WD40 repeat protein